MTDIDRRGILKMLGTVPVAGFALSPAEALAAQEKAKGAVAAAKGAAFAAKFFTAHEWSTVRLLADLVIPKDERSGSASEAGAPEFMDFMMRDPLEAPQEPEKRQVAMRGGLAWLDHQCADRFGKNFVACAEAERKAVLDDIAWPEKVLPEMKQGAHFFSDFRDLTASGFWSSKIGIDDLQYQGNTFVAEWKGCPPEVLARLGLKDA